MTQFNKFTLRINQDLINFLKKEASLEELSLSAYIRRMLKVHLNKTKHHDLVINDIYNRKWVRNVGKTSQVARKNKGQAFC